MRNPCLRFMVASALCLLSVGCGEASSEDVSELQLKATYIAGRDWPQSDGVVTIPYELTADIPSAVRAEFLSVAKYVTTATSQRFQFVPWTNQQQKLRLEGRSSWSENVASCPARTCSFRLSHIVGVAHVRDGSSAPIRVYFADGTMRRASLDDLSPSGAENSEVTFPLNPQTGDPYTADDLAAVGWSGYIIAWYKNGYVSKGTETNLGSITSPTPYTRYSYEEPGPLGPLKIYLTLAGVAIWLDTKPAPWKRSTSNCPPSMG